MRPDRWPAQRFLPVHPVSLGKSPVLAALPAASARYIPRSTCQQAAGGLYTNLATRARRVSRRQRSPGCASLPCLRVRPRPAGRSPAGHAKQIAIGCARAVIVHVKRAVTIFDGLTALHAPINAGAGLRVSRTRTERTERRQDRRPDRVKSGDLMAIIPVFARRRACDLNLNTARFQIIFLSCD